jgi:beta-glucanase (GH16 family)
MRNSLHLFVAVLFINLSCGEDKPEWADEFDYEGLPDSTRWGYETGMLRNKESQYYTYRDINNARVKEGTLVIEARRQRHDTARYTSASLTTKNKKHFLYGRIEVRAIVPLGRGTWPAAWMLGENIDTKGWPACGEIDIMEHVGFDPLNIHGNIHTEAYNHVKGTNKGSSVETREPWKEFHIYAVEWRKDKMDFFVDDQLYFTFVKERDAQDVWPFDKPHFLILNLAIGGGWGGQHGIDDSKFPHRYVIDYVRVYRLD